MNIKKIRTVKNSHLNVIKYVEFEDGRRLVVTTNLHKGIATSYIYKLQGFDSLGYVIYNPEGMRIGRSTAQTAQDGFVKHFDKMIYKFETEKNKYTRIMDALED